MYVYSRYMDTLMNCITLHSNSYLPPEIRKMIFDLQEDCSCKIDGMCNAYHHTCTCFISRKRCKAKGKHDCSCPYLDCESESESIDKDCIYDDHNPTSNECRAVSGHICICPSELSGKAECIAKSHICTCGSDYSGCSVIGHL